MFWHISYKYPGVSQNLAAACDVQSINILLQGASLRGRPTPPATLALEEKVHVDLREADRRSMIEHTLWYVFMSVV